MVLLTGGSGLLPGEGVRVRGTLLADGGAVRGVGKGNSGEDAVSCRRTQEGQFLLLDRVGGRKWPQRREDVAADPLGPLQEASPHHHIGLQSAWLGGICPFPKSN